MGESLDHCPAGWIRQSRECGIQLIHNIMVVDYRAMSRPNIAWTVKSLGGNSILVGHSGLQPYNKAMEISLAPELEAKLNQIASETGKGANQVVQELVANYLDHDEWFKREVKKGLSSLDDGKSVSHEEVRRQMERILSS